jgi:hypothetical protein
MRRMILRKISLIGTIKALGSGVTENHLTYPKEEEQDQVSDEELLEAAQTVEEDPGQEEAMEKPSFGLTLSEHDCVSGLARAIAILEAYATMQRE